MLEGYHGRGIGKALFQAVVDSLQQKQYTSFMVWVLKDNPTLRFYQHLGGTVIEEKTIRIGEQDLVELALGYTLGE